MFESGLGPTTSSNSIGIQAEVSINISGNSSNILFSSSPSPLRCKDYLVQLQKSLKAKEAEVAETRRIAEECRANGHDTSVASSLTDLTPRSGGALERSDGESITSGSDSSNSNGSKKLNKRKSVDFHVTQNEGESGKRAKQVTSSSAADSVESSTSGDENDGPPGGRNITFGKEQTSVSMSDMTDSNKSEAGDKKRKEHPTTAEEAAEEADDGGAENNHNFDSISSISSTAAVVRGLGGSQNSPKTRPSGSRRQRAQGGGSQQDAPEQPGREKLPPIDEGCNANANGSTPVVAAGQSSEEEDADRSRSAEVEADEDQGDKVKEVPSSPQPHPKKKKRPRGSSTFHLDYREVFLKSNVPQLVASLNGRVVAWNDFLLSATGLGARDAGNLTVFGMVESDQLSELYAMVSKALAYRPAPSGGGDASGPDAPSGGGGAEDDGDTTWRSITLRCAPFRYSPKSFTKLAEGEKKMAKPGPLYMNITLMGDEDPGKRCFHCVLTDRPGEGGRVGGVTPGLFDLIGRVKEKSR